MKLSREGVDSKDWCRQKIRYRASRNGRADLGSFAELLEFSLLSLRHALSTALNEGQQHRVSQGCLIVTED